MSKISDVFRCPAMGLYDDIRCEMLLGHDGRHTSGISSWPQVAQTRPTAPAAVTVPGNGTEARSAPVVVTFTTAGRPMQELIPQMFKRPAAFPPPTVPRCDGCAFYSLGRCDIDARHPDPPMWIANYDVNGGALCVNPDHFCAAHEPATKENA